MTDPVPTPERSCECAKCGPSCNCDNCTCEGCTCTKCNH